MTHAGATEPARRGGFIFAVAAFFALGATSTVAQMIAWGVAGLPVAIEWSTGGLVALAASVAMWVWCRSWEAWWKWIWLPIAVIVVTTMFLADTAAKNYRQEQQAAACADWESELDDLIAQHDSLVAETEDHVANYAAGLSTDWEKFGMSAAKSAAIDERRAQEYYQEHGGPELEAQFDETQSQYDAAC